MGVLGAVPGLGARRRGGRRLGRGLWRLGRGLRLGEHQRRRGRLHRRVAPARQGGLRHGGLPGLGRVGVDQQQRGRLRRRRRRQVERAVQVGRLEARQGFLGGPRRLFLRLALVGGEAHHELDALLGAGRPQAEPVAVGQHVRGRDALAVDVGARGGLERRQVQLLAVPLERGVVRGHVGEGQRRGRVGAGAQHGLAPARKPQDLAVERPSRHDQRGLVAAHTYLLAVRRYRQVAAVNHTAHEPVNVAAARASR